MRLWERCHFCQGTVLLYLQWVRRFLVYCREHGLEEIPQLTLAGATQFTNAYVGPRTHGPVAINSGLVAHKALHAWAVAMTALGAQVPEWQPPRARVLMSPLLEEYRRFRLSHRGVAEGTLHRDIETAKGFLLLLRSRGKAMCRTAITDIDAFVACLSARVSRRTVADVCSSLRSFLRFLCVSGRLSRDISAFVVAPRIRWAERPPRALPWTDVQRILQSIPSEEAPGKRDLAMLLMLTLYGFGAAEVLALQLEDVDWKSGTLRVHRPKTGVQIELPLLPPIARALSAYLQSERPPRVRTRRIFVRDKIPYEPLTSGGIRHRIRYYARQAGVTAKVIGAQAFRHAHASRQVDAGANLKVVSDILGHRRPSSTSVYVRVALRRLREVALTVPK